MENREQARMSPTDWARFGLIAQPVEETPLERFMTVNEAEEPNIVYARDQMREIGIGLGDEGSIVTRRQAAERLAADVLASKEKKEKKERERKSDTSRGKRSS